MIHLRAIASTAPLLAAIAAAVVIGASPRAQAQFNGPTSTSQFELSDTVQLDRADGAAISHLERVKACLADRQWDEAVETLRQVAETSEGKLLGVTPSRWVNLGDYCQMQLAALPPEALKLYRRRVDPVAQKWYEDGIAGRNRKLLGNVVQQAFASSWGDKALLALGEMALESGDFTAARWHWERILPAEIPPGVANTWPGYPDTSLDLAMIRSRLVLVSILEGLPARAKEELTQLTRLHGEARGPLAGREVQYCAALGQLLAQSAQWPQPKPDPDWPTLAGGPARDKIAPAMVDVGSVAWRIPLPQPVAATSAPASRPLGAGEDGARPLSYYPLVVGQRVFVCDPQEILALRAADGKPAWGDGGPAIYREPWEGVTGALANSSNMLGTARYTMTIRDGRLYARMGSAVTSQPQQASSPLAPGCLVCLDLEAEGKLLWKATPEEGWAMEGAPLVEGARVFVAMRRSDIRPQAHVACFDALTGRLRWRRFICGAETPARGMICQTTHGLLSLAGDTIYYNTNLGAVAAVSADDGRILWVSLYPRDRQGDLSRPAPHWQRDLNPCVVDHGTLLVAPADSPRLLALDAATGQILWHSGAELEDVVQLLGVVGDQLIAGGQRLYWIGLSGPARGRVRHVWPDGQAAPGYGRGLLAGTAVLWPTRHKIYVLDQQTAEPKKVIDLAPFGAGGGNLLVTDGRLVVATSNELIAFSPGAGKKESQPELTRFGCHFGCHWLCQCLSVPWPGNALAEPVPPLVLAEPVPPLAMTEPVAH